MSKAANILQQVNKAAICLVAATFVWPQYLAVVSVSLWLLVFLVSFGFKNPTCKAISKICCNPCPYSICYTP
ncbi:MAG: hypothetical protein M0D57_16425 [Sphingobacteriales bacterium JAD_PAG50586_3]|nr:MAG: hypothetical protein M0D57_16425 [Sphingobacteriales bacterium JAD_PAG50586_3]